MKRDAQETLAFLGNCCDECGSQRVPVTSGMVCPKGHGGIHPRPDDMAANSKSRRSLYARKVQP